MWSAVRHVRHVRWARRAGELWKARNLVANVKSILYDLFEKAGKRLGCNAACPRFFVAPSAPSWRAARLWSVLMMAPRPSPPRPSPLVRFLRRLAITAGIGAAIALVIRLYELYLKPRLMPPEEEARNLPAPSISKRRPSELSSSCAAAAVAWASSARSRKSSYAKPYAAFISHMKAETSMESRFIQTELESKLGRKCFLDSDDLRDLSDLTQHVRDSDVLAR